MDKLAYKIALIVALISFIINLVINISIFTGLIRSIAVYIGVLFVFFLSGIIMKWGINVMTPKTESSSDEEDQNLEESI